MSPLKAFERSKPTITRSGNRPTNIVLFPLRGSAIKGKRADFTSNHGVAHNRFSQLSFFLQSDIDTSVQGHFSHQ